MFQPKKLSGQSGPPIQLPQLASMPGFDDIHFQLMEAEKGNGREVEMPWSMTETNRVFKLSCTKRAGSEPVWSLFEIHGKSAEKKWSHPSGDMGLILNLCLSECDGGLLAGATSDASGFAASLQSKQKDTGDDQYSSGSSMPAFAEQTLTELPAEVLPKGRASLEGDLKNVQMPNLLQTIQMSKMTGRLGVTHLGQQAEAYFVDGEPTDATTPEAQASNALIDMLTWHEGKFHFHESETTEKRTINRALNSLLMEGVALLDQDTYLKEKGLSKDSILIRCNQNLTERQFEEAVSKVAPIDLTLQKNFYQLIDNSSSLFSILRTNPLEKVDWVPVLFNLLASELIELTDEASLAQQPRPLESMGIDRAAIDGIQRSLMRPETGLFTYPAFLYFTELEHYRYQRVGSPYSVIVFEIRARQGNQVSRDPLPMPAVLELSTRISSIKRIFDILGHFETFDYAILLPSTNSAQAGLFANRIVEILTSAPLMPGMDHSGLALALGVACVPDDFQDLGATLGAARQAKEVAKSKSAPIMLAKHLKNS